MADRAIDFTHRHFAHCESGSTSNLLFHHGINASEALVFGIGSGLFFGYFPFLKHNGLPLITYRSFPGRLLKNVARRLGIEVRSHKFKDPEKGMGLLDDTLNGGTPVGLQTGVYWLPYFPPALRIHFNAHIIVAYGKGGGDYLISDPVFDEPLTCPAEDLKKARFAKGMLSPKGRMFYFAGIPEHVDLASAIIKGIKETCFTMLAIPMPIIGVRGIRYFAKTIKSWPEKYGQRKALVYLGHAIRMQEEVGTGGGGFRLMYAAFLQEAAAILNDERFRQFSQRMTAIGDRWRDYAVSSARIYKDRASKEDNFGLLGDILLDCAGMEQDLYRNMSNAVRRR